MPIADLADSFGSIGAGLRVATADNPGPLTLEGSQSYLVGSERAVLIDPGPSGPEQQALLEQLIGGRDVRLVCLTHAHSDHSGAAREVASRLGCEVAASADTLARLALAGRVLEDGEEIPADEGSRLRVLATPGHTRDHLSFLFLPGRQLFTGDLVLGTGTSVILHPDGEVGAYLASLERLIVEAPTVILPGHGDPVTHPVERLREYVEHRLEREAQIVSALAQLDDASRSVEAIRDAVYGPLPPEIGRAAIASVRAHLRHIETRDGLPSVDGYPGDPMEETAIDENGVLEA